MRIRRLDPGGCSAGPIQAKVSRELSSCGAGQTSADEFRLVWSCRFRLIPVRIGRFRMAEPHLRLRSRKNSVDDVAVDVGQSAIDSVVAKCEMFVVEAEQVENRRVQVMY